MNIKVRLAKLEASIPTLQEKRFVFMTRAENDNSEIIAFKYKEEIIRTENETFKDFQSRGETFFSQYNPKTTVFIIQCVYE